MALADNLSITALVVSLIALFIALLQLSQSFLGTAEGYRRCAESVIGAWHKLRHRHWRWSEFRFETQYVTPQILVTSASEFAAAQEQHEIYKLAHPSMLNSPDCPELRETVHGHPKAHQTSVSQSKSSQQKNGNGHGDDPEKGVVRRSGIIDMAEQAMSLVILPVSIKRRRKRATANELKVTWLHLLGELHNLYYSYHPSNCENCANARIPTKWTVADENHKPGECPLDKLPEKKRPELKLTKEATDSRPPIDTINDPHFSVGKTDAAVIYRQWTWDFMPPDTVKPLAEATVGDIVILARRMDMQWRELDLQNSRIQAEGNGYSLTSTEVKGLGIVLRFSSIGRHGAFPRIIPSKAGDKLICGIVPGCPALVRTDFEIVRPDRSIPRVHAPGGVLADLGVPDDICLEIAGKKGGHPGGGDYQETDTECLILLCAFLPLPHSTIVSYNFFGLRPGPGVRKSVFHFWEGRWALFHKLTERVEQLSTSQTPAARQLFTDLSSVHASFSHLESFYRHDFYCRWGRAVITHAGALRPLQSESDRATNKEGLVEFCRNAFDDTTRYLAAPGREMHEEVNGKTRYLHLVAGHVVMAHKAIREALAFVDHQPKEQREQGALRRKYGFDPPGPGARAGNFVFQQQVEIGLRYAQHLRHGEHGVRRYLLERAMEFEEEEVEGMWWNLMLRGVVWDMGSWGRGGEEVGERVPSAFYGDRTPVWIS
ncbi:MAG: hypothetical protein Q9160_000407 [Pyrenula sp. 1 TL-2023]